MSIKQYAVRAGFNYFSQDQLNNCIKYSQDHAEDQAAFTHDLVICIRDNILRIAYYKPAYVAVICMITHHLVLHNAEKDRSKQPRTLYEVRILALCRSTRQALFARVRRAISVSTLVEEGLVCLPGPNPTVIADSSNAVAVFFFEEFPRKFTVRTIDLRKCSQMFCTRAKYFGVFSQTHTYPIMALHPKFVDSPTG